MKRKLLFLMLAVGLLGLGMSASVQAGENLTPNPFFELDANQEVNLEPRDFSDVYFWNQWGDAALAYSDHFEATLHAELGYASIWSEMTPFVVEADTLYYLECDIKSLSGPGAKAGLEIEDSAWSNDQEIVVEAPDSGWGRVLMELDTHAGGNGEVLVGGVVSYGVRAEACLEMNPTGNSLVAVTNMYFGIGRRLLAPVHTPNPADGEQGVNPSTTVLSWERDTSLGGRPPSVELYWGTQDDPNFWGFTDGSGELVGGGEPLKIMALSDVNSFDLGDAIGGPITLAPREYYYWTLKYEDPNDGFWGAPLLKTSIWSFDTINRPPSVDAGLHYDMWMPLGNPPVKIGLDATITDDGNPEGGNVTYEWVSEPAGPVFTPTNTCQDPNITISTPGAYKLTLTVHDDEGGVEDEVGQGSVLIRAFANEDDRLRAHYPLDTDAADIVGSHNGTLQDDASWNPSGQVAGAIELDGIDDVDEDGFGDFVSIDDTGSDPNWQPDTWENDLIDGMTISVWMKLDEDGWNKSWETIVAKSTDSWELLRDGSTDNIGFGIKSNIGAAASSNTDVTTGWHQVIAVYDRNTVKVYIDGLEEGSANAGTLSTEMQTTYDQEPWQIPKSGGKILIGNTNNPSINPDFDCSFGGLIDQVRIFDAAVPWWAEHTGTPGIVEMYRADGGHISCGGQYLAGDVNEDCLITLADFATVAFDWLDCTDVINEDCPLSHHEN